MNHEQARLALIGLADNATRDDHAAAIDAIMAARDEGPQVKTWGIPLPDGRWAHLTAPFPLTPTDWQRMQQVLDAMQVILVAPEPEVTSAEAGASVPGPTEEDHDA